jgi:hypothetical protein
VYKRLGCRQVLTSQDEARHEASADECVFFFIQELVALSG